MYLILSYADTAYTHGIDNSYFDVASIASSLPDHRRKSLIASRFLLCHAIDHFYNKKVQISFDKGEHGKPFLKDESLFFNLSHSGNYIALILSDHIQCGIDIETIKDRKAVADLARRIFSDHELAYFYSLSKDEALLFFYRMWTVRECLLKQSGLGLAGLESIKFSANMQNISSISNPKGKVMNMLFNKKQAQDSQYFVSCFYTEDKPLLYMHDGSFKNHCADTVQTFKVNA